MEKALSSMLIPQRAAVPRFPYPASYDSRPIKPRPLVLYNTLMIDHESAEKNEHSLWGAEILENGALDIINGQGCLILKDGTVLFSGVNTGGELELKELPRIPVTSHGFMNCAEVAGEIENGLGRLYIHSIDAQNLEEILRIMSDYLDTDKQIEKLNIRCDFSREFINDQNETELTEGKINSYRETAKKFAKDVIVENEEHGVHPAKIMSPMRNAREEPKGQKLARSRK